MKKISFGIFILALLAGGFTFATSANAAVTDNLAAYWHLNEASGSTRIDSKTTSDLAETSGTVPTAAGKIGNAVTFSGVGSPYLSVSDNATISACDCDFTVAGWVYITDTAQNLGIVSKYSTSTSTREWLLGYRQSDNHFIFTVTDSSSASATVATTSAVTVNTWYFVVGWYNAAANTLNIQVNNGTAVSASQTTGIRNGAQDLKIGPYTTGNTGSGRVDMVGIWRQVVSAGDKTSLYNAGAGLEIYITPSAPSTVVATGSNQSATVQWTAVTDATDYIIEYKLSSDSSWTTFADGTSTKRGATITGLTNGLSYDIRVSVTVNTVTSAPSSTVTVTPSAGYDYDFYNHVLSTGQSLSLGQLGTPVLTTTQPYNNKMLTSNTGSLTPLIESSVETMSSALANMFSSLVDPSSHDAIVTLHGVGATDYSGLKKGTTPYSNGILQMNTSFNNALAAGKNYRVEAVTSVHGESDQAVGAGPTYQGYLEEWQNDYQTDVQAVTGQTGTIPMFVDQMASHTSYPVGVPTTALGQLQAARDNPGVIYMVAPNYIYDYADHAHLANISYRRMGEYFGKIMKRVFVDGATVLPFAPNEIIRQGNIIHATFDVPVAPLAFDTTRVTLKTNYGFEYYDSTSSATISSVELEDSDTVKITLNTTPTGSDQRLRYAYTGGATDDTAGNRPGRDQANSARGNLRDSDTQASLYTGGLGTMGNVLYNWSAIFDDPITDATAVPDAPTIGTATAGNGQASVTFSAPAFDGGSAITGYTVTSSPGSFTGTGASSPITVTGLSNGTSYTFTVTATNAIGTSSASAASNSVTPSTVPGAPTGLGATAGNSQVSLSWTAPASNGGASITDYLVEYKLASEPTTWTTFSDGVSTSTAATVTGLVNGASYNFRVSAINVNGAGTASGTATTTPITTPGAPTGLTPAAGDEEVALTWTAPVSNGGASITDYLVEYKRVVDSLWTTFVDGTSTTTAATVTGLTNGTAYHFRASAINAAGTGTASSTATETPVTIPDAPTIGTATEGDGQVTVTFTPPVDDGGTSVTSYTVTSSPGSITASGSSSPIIATGLSNGTPYTFTVTATNAVGESAPSAASNSATPAATPNDAPSNLAATPGNQQAALDWDAPLDDGGNPITDYLVEYKLSIDSSWSTFADGTSTTTAATVTSLTNGSSYDFRVSAINALGTGPSSSTAVATPRTVPGAPTSVTATAGDGQADVIFTAPASNGGATITLYTATSNPGSISGTSSSSPITVTGLSNGTAYTFTVTATNIAGTGSASSASNSVTPSTVPDIPTNLAANAGDAEVDLTWDAPAFDGGSAITDYLIEFKLSSGSIWSTFPDGTSTSASATVTGLINNSSYDFRVSAENNNGVGAASSTDSATPVGVAAAPDAPANLVASAGNAEVDLVWDAPSDNGSAITDYAVEYKLSSDSSWTVFPDGTSTATSATVTGLTNDLAYDFRVSATNAIGTSSPSSTDSATPSSGLTVPDAPTIGAATAGDGEATVTFTSPVDDGGSAITLYTVTSNPGSVTASGSSSPITVPGLTNGTPYTFTVTATNAIGESAASSASNSVTPSAAITPPPPSPSPAPTSQSSTSGGYTTDPTQIPGSAPLPLPCTAGALFNTSTGAPCGGTTSINQIPTPSVPAGTFIRNLTSGDTGTDVMALQRFLNAHGFVLALSGPGLPGNETMRFGALTRAALIRFQEAYAAQILKPLGLTRGTGFFGTATRNFIENNF